MSNAIEKANAKANAASRGFAVALSVWMQRVARAKLRQANARLRSGGLSGLKNSKIAKSESDDMERELLALFRRYGLYEYGQAGAEAARFAGAQGWTIPRDLYDELKDAMASKVKLLVSDTEDMVRESLQGIIAEALEEDPEPSAAEVGRRIARQWMGPPDERVPARGSALEIKNTADWARSQQEIDDGGREHLFSFTRAQTIARTEIGQARTAGTAAAYADVGVEYVKWMAYPNDGRSGDRQHWKMNNHKAISTEDMQGGDPSKWFRLPDGERAPYPQWSGLPAKHVVNCRCVLVPA